MPDPIRLILWRFIIEGKRVAIIKFERQRPIGISSKICYCCPYEEEDAAGIRCWRVIAPPVFVVAMLMQVTHFYGDASIRR